MSSKVASLFLIITSAADLVNIGYDAGVFFIVLLFALILSLSDSFQTSSSGTTIRWHLVQHLSRFILTELLKSTILMSQTNPLHSREFQRYQISRKKQLLPLNMMAYHHFGLKKSRSRVFNARLWYLKMYKVF